MSQDKINVLASRNTADAERIALYKKQIAQLAACINEREARIARRQEHIVGWNHRLAAEFNLRVNRASDDASLTPLSIGDEYRNGKDRYVVTSFPNQVIGVVSAGRVVVSGKDLATISKVFFYDYPNAVKVS